MTSVGSILNGAFRLFREQPAIVAIWAGLHIIYGVAAGSLVLAGFVTDFEAMRTGAVSPLGGFGAIILLGFVGLLAVSVMNCAIYRAILRPEERGFAWLRLGSDEFRMFGLYLIFIAIGIFAVLIVGLIMFMTVRGAGVAMGGGGGFGIGMLFVVVFGLLAVYVSIRLSLVAPMTFVRRKISVDEGWGLSSGRFWTLFLAFLVIWIILIAIQMFVPSMPGQPGFLEAIRSIGDPDAMRTIEAGELATAGSLGFAAMLPYLLISSLVQVISTVTTNAAAATAAREFLRDDGEVLDDDIETTAQIFE